MQEFPLAKAFTLLEPGPVTLVTTAAGRRRNVMTITWTLVMDFTPKLAFVTGPWNHVTPWATAPSWPTDGASATAG